MNCVQKNQLPLDPSGIAEHVYTVLKSRNITWADVEKHYLENNVPDMIVVYVYLGSRQYNTDVEFTPAALITFAFAGQAISKYIDQELADDHPTDKRFLLRHMELLCLRYDLRQFKTTGFGHDLIYSRDSVSEHYPKFDNSLYIPPLTGHWAIATKGAARD